METRCYFNDIDLSQEEYNEVDKICTFIDLNVDYAEDVCEKLLYAGIINSYIIPAFSPKPTRFI